MCLLHSHTTGDSVIFSVGVPIVVSCVLAVAAISLLIVAIGTFLYKRNKGIHICISSVLFSHSDTC